MTAPSIVPIRVRVTPRGGRDAVIGYRRGEGILLVRVAAPPVDGAANKACLELLAQTFGVKRAQVRLAAGETAREKRFEITGISEAEREERLNALPAANE